MDMYRILENFDAVNSKQALTEGAVKRELHAMADKMTKAEFVAKADEHGMGAKEAAEFWINCKGDDDKKLDEAEGGSSPTKVMKKYLPRSMWDPILSHSGKSKHNNADGSKTSHVWRLRNLVRSFRGREFDAWKQAVEQELGSGYEVTSEWPTPSVRYIQMNNISAQQGMSEADMEEGNKFAHNVLKAKAAGMKKADLDGNGDMETVREVFPGTPEYELRFGKDDASSAFDKKKISTGTVYSRKHFDEPESDDDAPRAAGRPTGTGRKLGAKGPSVHSKLLKGKGGLKEHDDEMNIHNDQDSGEYDDEAGMARQDLHTVVDAAKELHDILASDENLPEWVQAKITKALDYIDTSRDYMKSVDADRGDQPVAEIAPVIGAIAGRALAGAAGVGSTGQALGGLAGRAVVGAMNNDEEVDEAGYSAKAARAGKDIGKPGKNFAKIAKSSGGGEKGQRIAGAVLNKLRHPTEEGATPDQLDQQKMSQMKRAAATRTNSRNVQKQLPQGGPGRAEVPAFIRKARGDAPLGRNEVEENGMGGTVAGGIAPAPGAKTFAEASSESHTADWKAAGKAVHAILKSVGYKGSKTEKGYMWTKQTPKGTAFVDIDFDERDPEVVAWGEGELKGAKDKSYWQSGSGNIGEIADKIAELFANVKHGHPAGNEVDEADKDGKPNFAKKDGKHKPDDDGDGVPDWADKKPGKDDNEELDDSEESDDDKELKLMKSRAGVEDKDEEDDKAEKAGKKVAKDIEYDDKDDDESDEEKDDKAEKDGKKVTKDIEYDDEKDEEEKDSDEDDEKTEESADKPNKSGGMKVGTGVYESAFNKSLKAKLNESINMNTSQDSDGQKSVTITATDEDSDKLSDLLKMAGLFSSEGYSSVCQNCGGIHEADACGADHVEEAYGDFDITTERDLANSPDEVYTDADYMTQTLSGGLDGPKKDQTTNPIVKLDRVSGQIEEAAKTRLWNLYKQYDKK